MQLKNSTGSTRGIQKEDVWAAADALIAEGQRPTIERVRLHLGRGSPNTVSPLLDGWFATLGARLRGQPAGSGAAELPAPVAQAATALWQRACEQAQQAAGERLAADRQALEAGCGALDRAQGELERQQASLVQREAAMQETLLLAKGQLAQLQAQGAALQETVQGQGAALMERQRALDQSRREREADRQAQAQQAQAQIDALRRAEERAVAHERRLLADVDRLRQEAKAALAALADHQRRADALRQAADVKLHTLNEQLHQAALEGAAQREKEVSAQARLAELQGLLQAQTQAVQARVSPKQAAAALPARRRLAKTVGPRRGGR
jgi:chromosome segregation ATPase